MEQQIHQSAPNLIELFSTLIHTHTHTHTHTLLFQSIIAYKTIIVRLPRDIRIPKPSRLKEKERKDQNKPGTWLTSIILATQEVRSKGSTFKASLGKQLVRPHLKQ
jgi:hypothetical protein